MSNIAYIEGGVIRPFIFGDQEYLGRFLDTVGDGSGVKNASVNHAGAAQSYQIIAPAGSRYIITELTVNIRDGGTIDSNQYGNGIGLTNGITVQTSNGTPDFVLTDSVPILTNNDWGRFGSIDHYTFGSGAEYLLSKISFLSFGQRGLVLEPGTDADRLEVILNDNFSGLQQHYFYVKGYIETL